MYKYLEAGTKGRLEIESKLMNIVTTTHSDEVELVNGSSEHTKIDNHRNPDRLRTMFRVETDTGDRVMRLYQMIDSVLVVRQLRSRLSLKRYFSALAFGKTIGSATVIGVLFEELMHKWFEETNPGPIAGVFQATGTGANGVAQLTDKNVYWMPSIPNYPNIDAAVVINNVLYVIQYTKRTGHGFDEDALWRLCHSCPGKLGVSQGPCYCRLIGWSPEQPCCTIFEPLFSASNSENNG